eukprot:TRINITY_DN26_c0_g1_i1.p1 TRINITY_DN26_c0_g1~~TRINITY_DN26_c0_g1_i1.p1  ORF type:complete len:354 (+),score=60.27 TRINITY_DN26_c0_g1_i1:91-1152(+)
MCIRDRYQRRVRGCNFEMGSNAGFRLLLCVVGSALVQSYTPPAGTAGNEYDDGDRDASKYVYDPKEGSTLADTLPDQEGSAPPVPHWHACRFQAKAGGVYDLRPMMRLAKTLEDDWIHNDATASGTTYYMNICANTMVVPQACKALAKKDPSPAYQVSSNGHCYYLGTLKTFKWKPIDSLEPGKGMILAYQNGERCGDGVSRQIKYTVTCSENYGYDDGPLVVYETRSGCHYDVHWPNKAGCPKNGVITTLAQGNWGPGSVFMVVVMLVLCVYICGGCFYKRKFEDAEGIEACPHHTLWCALPAVFMAGCQWVYDKLAGANTSRAGFSRVPTSVGQSQYGASDSSGGIKDDMF